MQSFYLCFQENRQILQWLKVFFVCLFEFEDEDEDEEIGETFTHLSIIS